MRNRSNLLVLLGIAFFVVGGIIVYVVTNGDDGGTPSTAPGQTVVVVATHDIASGAKADDEIESGGLKEQRVTTGQVVPGAVQSLQALSGGTFIQPFADGDQVLQTGLQAVRRGYDLPDGYEAVAVNLDFVNGVAGYVNPGDHVNLYGVYGAGTPLKGAATPRAELLMTNIKVLDTSQTIPANGTTPTTLAGSTPGATSRASGSTITYLLAVKTADAEKVIFDGQFNSIYATLVNDGAAPSGPTDGISGDNVLAVEPNVAAQG